MTHDGDPYAEPILYDTLHSPGSRLEAEALLRAHRECTGGAAESLRALEPACGSGRLLRALAPRVRSVHGFDINQRMLDYAAARLPAAKLFRAGMEDFHQAMRAASIDLAVNTINSIRHIETDAALQRHLAGIARVLAEGGVYLVGISLCDYAADEPSEDHWRARRGRLTVFQLIQYLPPASERRRDRFEQVYAHLRIERPGGVETRDHAYRLRAYDRSQWEAQIERSPLHVLGHFDDKGRPLEEPAEAYGIYALAAR